MSAACSPCREYKKPVAVKAVTSRPVAIKKSGGAALVLALIIVAVVAALGVKFGEDFALSMARSENRWYGSQAQNYLLATESVASHFLEQDLADSDYDSLQEPWATELTLPTDDGYLQAQLEDAQGRFNLNTLAIAWTVPGENVNPQPHERFSPAQKRFIRLLQIFEDDYPVTEQEAIAITEAVIDWVDDDGENLAGFGGAESLHYSGKTPPYEPANQMFDSVSELQMVEGVTPELYRLLEPLLVVLPKENTTLNINTALPPLLRTLNAGDMMTPLAAEDISSILEERELQPFETIDDFLGNPAVRNSLPGSDEESSGYGVVSSYFLLHARASVGEQIRYIRSHLQRTDEDKVVTLKRRYTSY